jgi:glycosyltransferase involved in cell wall biosynthesis
MILPKDFKKRTFAGVFVVDRQNSGLWRSAIAHSKFNKVRVIAATEYFSPHALARDIMQTQPQYIIFSWRPAFDAIMFTDGLSGVVRSTSAAIFLLIPDHVGLDFISNEEQERILASDGLLVTSEILKREYPERYKVENIQVLHDLPDFVQIDKIKSKSIGRRINKIIWVGNSAWGKRLGYKDHKGLHRFFLPAMQILKSIDETLEFEVIDSARNKQPHEEVLHSIQESSCLVVTSDSEGTCLPILEAAALGTPVVTFDVGIANELLCGQLRSQISKRELSVLIQLILNTVSNFESVSNVITSRIDEYRQEIEVELTNLKIPRGSDEKWRSSRQKHSRRQSLVWKLRWIRNGHANFLSKASHRIFASSP